MDSQFRLKASPPWNVSNKCVSTMVAITDSLIYSNHCGGLALAVSKDLSKKTLMQNKTNFEIKQVEFLPLGSYVSTELKNIGSAIQKLINIAAEVDKIEIKEMVFKSKAHFDPDKVSTVSDLVQYGIPLLDFLFYRNLTPEIKKEIVWEVDDTALEFTETKLSAALMSVYFMNMTRGKTYLDESSENLPLFLEKILAIDSNIYLRFTRILSNNNLDRFNHLWIKEITVAHLPKVLRARLLKGISGSRLFSIFRDYKPDLLTPETEQLYLKLRDLALRGPFYEFHHLYQGDKLEKMSISRNLSSLIGLIYSEQMIQVMKKNKSLFKEVVYNDKYQSFLLWDDDNFFSQFKTPLIRFD